MGYIIVIRIIIGVGWSSCRGNVFRAADSFECGWCQFHTDGLFLGIAILLLFAAYVIGGVV